LVRARRRANLREVNVAKLFLSAPESASVVFRDRASQHNHGFRRVVARYIRRWPLGAVAVAFLSILVVIAALAPVIAPFDPVELHRVDRLQGPSWRYWLGTDYTGRDQLSRIIYGSRVSLLVGIAPICISVAAGTALGALSGLLGGVVDTVIQRLTDALMAIPALVVALTLVSLLGPSTNNVVLAIAFVTTPLVNRIARAATLQVESQPYVLAARALGASNLRLLLRHVLPNILAPMIVLGASLVGAAILAEAGLSFLGLGVPPPQPTWGNMLTGDNRSVFEIAPWLVIFPGLAITITVLAVNLLGDALRDALDPRVRRNGE